MGNAPTDILGANTLWLVSSWSASNLASATLIPSFGGFAMLLELMEKLTKDDATFVKTLNWLGVAAALALTCAIAIIASI